MSKVQQKSSEIFDNMPLQIKTPTAKPKKHHKIEQHITTYSEVTEENQIYVSQLKELAKVFSSSADKHIRQYIINLAKGVIEGSADYKRVEGYVKEMLS